ncbi:outer membrane protein [Helicobacter cetorum]|uniref:outer membrane protein n=1 Tax=Helicobacter cetorum TaxID=138563 RepID=UPI002D7A3D46|nr:outer membrane protein [Helicobacter cetorum]
MKNIFHKNGRLKAFCLSLVASLSLSELGAEEDSFFFGIDYQASLARQDIKNPGYASAQLLREEIKQGAMSVNSAAVPLAYYLELLGSKTVELMNALCPNGQCKTNVGNGATQMAGLKNFNDTKLLDALGALQVLLSMSQTEQYAKDALAGKLEPLVIPEGYIMPNGMPLTIKGGVNITEAMFAVAQQITNALGVVSLNAGLPGQANGSLNSQNGEFPNGGCGQTAGECNTAGLNPSAGTTLENGAQQLYNFLMQAILLGVGELEHINQATHQMTFSNPFYWSNPGNQRKIGSNGQYVYNNAHGISIGDVATGMQSFGSQASLLGAHSTIAQINALVSQGLSLSDETKHLGNYIYNTVCKIGANICGLPNDTNNGQQESALVQAAQQAEQQAAPVIEAKLKMELAQGKINQQQYEQLYAFGLQQAGYKAVAETLQKEVKDKKLTEQQALEQNYIYSVVHGGLVPFASYDPTTKKYTPKPQWVMGNQLGAKAARMLVNQNLEELVSGAKKLYNISYVPNLQSLNSSQSGDMNGFGVKMGYKQFFGRKRNLGLRYYGFLDYGNAKFGNGNLSVQTNLVTYGVGTDLLYNVFERSRGREKTTLGLFAGIQLAGQSWFSNVLNQLNGKMPSDTRHSSFQFLFDLGVRTNFSRRKPGRHTWHQGIEVGVKIPTIQHTYFKTAGASASYIRNFSFYVGYTVGF